MKVEDIIDLKKATVSDKKFERLLVKFLLDEPFFSSIVINLNKVKTRSIPTAGVAVKNNSLTLYWNPEFISTLNEKQFFGLMKHECYHLIYQHVVCRKQDPHTLWNIATDLAINSMISSEYLPPGGLVPGQKFKNEDSNPCPTRNKISDFISKLPKYKSSEWYMDKLKTEDNGKLGEEISDYFDQTGDGSGPGFDVHIESDENMSESDKKALAGKLKEIIKKSAKKANKNNSWGSASQSVRDEITKLFDDRINWKKTLSYFCGTKQKSNKSKTFRRVNRKYPYIHPGTKVKRTSSLAIYIDQSGSVGDEGLSMFFSALEGLAKNISFKVFHFDTSVDKNSEYAWRKGQKYRNPMRTLTGGTCFDCVEDHFRSRSSEFDGYILMTDGGAPKPKTCISKRCWVLLPGYELYFQKEKRDFVVQMEI